MRKLEAAKVGPDCYQVDMRGWMCPYPKYAIESLLQKLPRGNSLALLVDCPAATTDVPAIARARGFAVPEVSRLGDGEWRIVIAGGAVEQEEVGCLAKPVSGV